MPGNLTVKRLCKTPKGSLTKKTSRVNTRKQRVEEYLCVTCGKQFRLKHRLETHERLHTGDHPFVCPSCNKGFGSKASLTNHTAVHTNERRFRCDECSLSFRRKHRLETHERLHTGEHPFVCPFCNKGFRSKESLTNHAAVHTNERRFRCNECSLSFKTAHQLSKHRRFMQLAKSRKEPNHHRPVKCKLCDFLITSKIAAKIHASEHKRGIMDKDVAGPYMCSMCKESFQTPKQLGEHYRQLHQYSASSDKKHADKLDCVRCRRTFGCKTSNSNQKEPFACRVPRVHQVHSYSQAERCRYACHRCGQTFPKSASLGKHLATHFEVDPYTCDSCKAEFADESSYLAHNCPKQSAGTILVVKIMSQMGSTQPSLQENTLNLKDTTQATDTATSNQDDVSQQQLCLNIVHPLMEKQENLQMSAKNQLENLSGEINLLVPVNKLVSESKPVLVVKFLTGK